MKLIIGPMANEQINRDSLVRTFSLSVKKLITLENSFEHPNNNSFTKFIIMGQPIGVLLTQVFMKDRFRSCVLKYQNVTRISVIVHHQFISEH